MLSHTESALLCGRFLAEMAEGNHLDGNYLVKIFFEQLWKVGQKIKVVHYFDNCKGNFFSRAKSQQFD